ncbi:MAG: MFS transporter [Nocardioides sp.]
MASPAPTDLSRDRIPREIWILIASSFLVAVGFGLITPVLPQFAQSFGVGATASSIVISAFAFFRLVGAPGGGRLVARLGERPVYLTGLLVVAGSTAATGFASSYWQLLVFRSLGGLGSTMFTVSALALIVRLSPPAIRGGSRPAGPRPFWWARSWGRSSAGCWAASACACRFSSTPACCSGQPASSPSSSAVGRGRPRPDPSRRRR